MFSAVEYYMFSSNSSNSLLENHDLKVKELRKRRKLRRNSNIFDLPCTIFQSKFRLSKKAFRRVLREIQGDLKTGKRKDRISKVTKLATTLRFLAQGSYQLSVANDNELNISQPSVSKILMEVLPILERKLCPKLIRFQYSETEISEAKEYFYNKSHIPGVIGCVDGTHVSIIKPKKQIQHLYYNRKGYHSLNAMIVCDHKMKIRYINSRHPGSAHDSFVWTLSPIKNELQEMQNSGVQNTWLLGDKGYQLQNVLLTPFRNPGEHSPESTFNTNLAKARIIIENCIGVLKSRFRCLRRARELCYSPRKAIQIVNVCCALHNLCLEEGVEFEGNVEDSSDEECDAEEDDAAITSSSNSRISAESIRHQIIREMMTE